MRYNQQDLTGTGLESAVEQQSAQSATASTVRTQSLNVTAGATLGATLLNETRVLYARDSDVSRATSDNPQADIRQGGALVFRIGQDTLAPHETGSNAYRSRTR